MDVIRNGLFGHLQFKRYTYDERRIEDFSRLPRPFYSIAYLEKGSVRLYHDDTITLANAGDCFAVIKGGLYKGEYYEENTIMHSMHFDFAPTADLIRDYRLRFCASKIPDAARLFAEGENAQDPLFACSAALSIISAFVNNSNAEKTGIKRTLPALELISSDPAANAPVGALAKACAMSEPGFYRVFKAENGVSPIVYRNDLRLASAGYMLRETDMSVEEIAQKCGFESQTFFRRAFVKKLGCSPSAYRKNYGKNSPV